MKKIFISCFLSFATFTFIACDKNPHSKSGSHTSVTYLEDNKENRLVFKKEILMNELSYLKVEQKAIAQDLMRKTDQYGQIATAGASANTTTTQNTASLDNIDGFATADDIDVSDGKDSGEENTDEISSTQHTSIFLSKIATASEDMTEANYELNEIKGKIKETTLEIKLVEAQLNMILDKKILNSNELTDSETIRQLVKRVDQYEKYIKENGTEEDLKEL